MKQDFNEGAGKLIGVTIALALVTFGLGVLAVVAVGRKNPLRSPKRTPIGFILLLLGIGIGYFHKILARKLGYPFIPALSSVWLTGAGIALLTTPFWLWLLRSKSITTKHLYSRVTPKRPRKLPSKYKAFIGKSLVTCENTFLKQRERTMHTLVAGSTGSGKTTTLKALFYDAMEKGHPVLIIDPKGNQATIEEFKEIRRRVRASYGTAIEGGFKTFSIINPGTSARYNPLARGTSMQIRDRIMGAFEWSEPFYKYQASSWLGLAIDLLKTFDHEVTISKLHKLLVDPKELDDLEDACVKHPDKAMGKELLGRLKALARFDKGNLDGLISQLRDLDNLEFGDLFKPDLLTDTIDLKAIIEGRQVAYFQLNTMAYEGAAKAIGRLLLQDLKALASQVHGGQEALSRDFFPIFIDEFGSFAFEGFIDFLKMSRDVGFANHLFFQSLADLDSVSTEFKSQVQQNCLTKIIMRTDDPNEVDFWAGVAGTYDTLQASYQVESVLGVKMKTGQGNMRMTKQMRVEHDVFKRLQTGQAVLIQKAPAREDLLQLWIPTLEEPGHR